MKKSCRRVAVMIVMGILFQIGPGGTATGITTAAEALTGVAADIQGISDMDESNWAYESIKGMCTRGIIAGYPDHTFRPEKKVTYGEFIKMVSIMADGKNEGNAPGTAWAKNYYRKLLDKGYYTGFDIPEAKMNWTIPRGDMALVINGLIKEEAFAAADFDQVANRISDIESGTKNQVEIVKAYALDILTGYPDGTFRPEEKLSRGEAAAALYRVIQGKAETDKEADIGADTDKDIFSIISNMEDYRKDVWLETKMYKEITPESAGIRIRVPWDGTRAGFDHTMIGFIYLVKDNRIIEYCRSIPAETFITTVSHYDLKNIDFIVCVPSKNGTQTQILLMVNPFKGQV